ncbi:g3820 [Coccomyxa elongata]
MVPPTIDFRQVFAAHIACGWIFDIHKNMERLAPPAQLPAHVPAEVALRAHAYGLHTGVHACSLWGVSGCMPEQSMHLCLWKLMGAVSAARLAASALGSIKWTAAALKILKALVDELESSLTLPGPWKQGIGRREATRLLQGIQGAVQGAQSEVRSEVKSGSAELAGESAVLVIASLDAAYYALLEHHLSCGHETHAVPPPHVYLPAIIAANPGNAAACKQLVREGAPDIGKQLLRKVWGVRKVNGDLVLPEDTAAHNPLLAVMWARFQEGCRLFFASGLGLNGELDSEAAAEERRFQRASHADDAARRGGFPAAAKHTNAKSGRGSWTAQLGSRSRAQKSRSRRSTACGQKRSRGSSASAASDTDSSCSHSNSSESDEEGSSAEEGDEEEEVEGDSLDAEVAPAWHPEGCAAGEAPWPAYRALREWRQAGRECHLYAYAPFTRGALDALAERAPLLEIGAGLGYWAAALRARGVSVHAVDSHPPGSSTVNTYHGRIPAFTKVAQGGPRAAAAASEGHSLFLCYPPPGSPMAADCLRSFRGRCVCVVGEWLGDTADEAFAAALLRDWMLVRRVALPNWTDTSHELTIWQRGGPAKKLPQRKKPRHAEAEHNGRPLGSLKDGVKPSGIGAADKLELDNNHEDALDIISCSTCGVSRVGNMTGKAGNTGRVNPAEDRAAPIGLSSIRHDLSLLPSLRLLLCWRSCLVTGEADLSQMSPAMDVKVTAVTDKPGFVEPFKPIEGPTVWYGGDLDVQDIAYDFSQEDIEEIKSAVAAVEKRQLKVEEVTREDFVLPTLGPKLDTIHKDLIFGRGIRLLRNVPLGLDVTLKQSITALWGISTYFGKQVPLTQAGHLVGHVRSDEGVTKRISNCTPVPLNYHADNSDIVLLACRSQALSGGDSSCCSSHALHNEILDRRPDLHKILSEPFYSDRREWWPEGALPYYKSPCFHYHENTLAVQEVQPNLEEVAQHYGAPPVKPGQVEAIKLVQEVAAEPKVRFDLRLKPGDILLNHNLTTFHSRTTWQDGSAEDTKRHMFRIWAASPLGWPLDPLYAERWQTVEVGKRGGLEVRPPFHPHVAITPQEYFQDFNDWFALYRNSATTEHLKPPASRAEKQTILQKFFPAMESEANLGDGPALIKAEA